MQANICLPLLFVKYPAHSFQNTLHTSVSILIQYLCNQQGGFRRYSRVGSAGKPPVARQNSGHMCSVTAVIIHLLLSMYKIPEFQYPFSKIRMCADALLCQVVAGNFLSLFLRFYQVFQHFFFKITAGC